ncbi:Methyltransferase domain protein [compost metagenome]
MRKAKGSGDAADYYDFYRPGYPRACISQIEVSARLSPDSRLVEVGAGSGKASGQFLERGYRLLCIEPGRRLAELGQKKHRDKPVTYAISRFEDWDGPAGQYDLVFSAQAFHWVPQPEGYKRSARVLKPEGALALFWNLYTEQSDSPVPEYMEICRLHGLIPFQNESEIERRILHERDGIANSGYFKQPEVYRYPWSQAYDTESFLGLIRTGNGFLGLSEADQTRLSQELAGILNRNGGRIVLHYLCVLFIASKKAPSGIEGVK